MTDEKNDAAPAADTPQEAPKTWLQEIVQPFIDLIHAPRALWGINLAYVLEGMVYFGMLGYLALYFSDFVFQSVDGANEQAHHMVMVLTAGITISMFFLGRVADKRGVRFALLAAFVLMLVGRVIWSGAPNMLGFEPVRPGVFTGDKIALHVDRIETKGGVKTITGSTLVVTDKGVGGAPALAVDLSAGDGIVPTKEMESQLVTVTRATVLASESEKNRTLWKIRYGAKPVEAWLSTPEGMVCKDAVITLKRGYVSVAEFKLPPDAKKATEHAVIRATWNDDFGKVDVGACSKDEQKKLAGEKKERFNKDIEGLLRGKDRREVTPLTGDMEKAKQVNLVDLRAMKDGECNLVLRDVYVTQVIGGGYFLQRAAGGPAISVYVDPVGSMLQIITLFGMVLVVIGYGMYQPAAYAGVRKFTNPKTAAMGFAMLYALMNLGGWFPSFAYYLRNKEYLGLGYTGTFWVYTCFTALALGATYLILTKRTVADAEQEAKEETARINAAKGEEEKKNDAEAAEVAAAAAAAGPVKVKAHMWVIWLGAVTLILFKAEAPYYHEFTGSLGSWLRWICAAALFVSPAFIALIPKARGWIAQHPLQDSKFAFFIFALIPVQTLFTYNWLVLPAYIQRAIPGWLGENFELLANANPILIFIAVPIITALTQKAKVYNMMIMGTAIMAAPAFLNCFGPHAWTLITYIFIMTIGEAMWQPRFLQYAAEIAPEGRTGEYMGVAQFPWFLTKVLVPLLYSGWMMDRFCPLEGEKNTELMWLIFGCIAMCSTVFLILARGWVGKDFKTKA